VGTWRVAAAIGEGGLDASGGLGLGDAPTLRVDSARVRALDLESLGLAPWPTDLNGEASGTRTGAAEGMGDWTGDLSMHGSTVGPLVVDSVTARIALADGHFRADWSGRMLAGSIDGVVEGDLGDPGADDPGDGRPGHGEADGTRVRGVARGAFRGLDPEAMSGTRAGATALAGAYAAALDNRGVVAGGGSLSLTDSRIRALVVDTAHIEVRVRGDSLDMSAEIDSRGGTLRLRGARAPGDAGPTWRLADARFVDVDLGALADSGGVATRLTGSIVGVVSGSTVGAATGEAQLRLEPSSVGSWSVDSLGVVATLVEGRSLWTATIAGDDVSGTLSADVDVVDDPTRADGTARFGGAVRGVQVDSALATFRYASGAVTADTLLVWSPWVTASGRAASSADSPSERRSEASLVVDLNGPTALRGWLGLEVDELGVGHMELAGSAVGDSVAARAELRGTALAYGSTRIGELEAAGGGSWRPGRGPTGVAGVAEARALQLGQRGVERITVDVASEGEGVALTVDAQMDGTRRAVAGLWGRVVDGGATGTLRALDADLSGQVWRLDRPAELMVVDGFDVRDLSLSSPSGQISANGFVRPTGAQELVVSVDGLELAPFSDLLGYEGLGGRLDGSFDVTGTADAPMLVGSVHIVASLPETESATLDADTRYEGGVLDVDGSLALGGGGSARVLARLPYTVTLARADSVAQDDPPTNAVAPVGLVRDGPVMLDVRAERVGLDWLSPWMPPETARDLVGTLDGMVIVGGTTEDLTLDGSIELVGGGGELPGLGLRLHEGSFSGRLDGDLLVIDRASVRSGDGRLTTTGSVRADDLTTGELDLHVTLDDFQVVNTQMVRGVLDADLDIAGTTRAPIVTGAVDVLRGDVFLSDELAGARAEAVELTDADYAMLAEWFGYEPPADSAVARPTGPGPLAADVQLRLGRDVWIRQNAGPKLSIQLTGDLRVQKEADELERVFGTLEAVPRGSYVEQFGRRFAITRGEVVFNGPPEELRLDVSSEYAVPSAGDPTSNEVVIGLGVIGGLEDMALVLSSEPEMENADIVSYLATGRPSSQTLQFDSEGDGLVERGADIALGQATDAVERLASESIGLDVVQIRTDGTRGVTIAAGRYVSPRLYLGFSQPVSFRRSEASSGTRTRSPEVEIEYQAFRWLLLNLRREGSRLDFFLRSRHAY
jgi:translocation and assembly module TamB